MKTVLSALGLALLFFQPVCAETATENSAIAETRTFSLLLTFNTNEQASNALLRISLLWPSQSATYVKTLRSAAGILGQTSLTNLLARKTLQQLFKQAMSVPVPTNQPNSAVLLMEKCNAVASCLCYAGCGDDRNIISSYARFIGEIRSQVIPNYTNKWVWHSPVEFETPPEQRAHFIQTNASNKMLDDFQQELHHSSGILMLCLFSNGNRVSDAFNNDEKIQILKEVTFLAGLDQVESQMFEKAIGVSTEK